MFLCPLLFLCWRYLYVRKNEKLTDTLRSCFFVFGPQTCSALGVFFFISTRPPVRSLHHGKLDGIDTCSMRASFLCVFGAVRADLNHGKVVRVLYKMRVQQGDLHDYLLANGHGIKPPRIQFSEERYLPRLNFLSLLRFEH